MRRTKGILLTASLLALNVSGVHASVFRHHSADKPAETAPAPASMSLNSIDIDGSRVLLRTSGTPAYTSYSPSPDLFVIDLSATSKGAVTIPSTLPAGVSAIDAVDATEMGTRLTRVTFHLSTPMALQASAADNSVTVQLPVTTQIVTGPTVEPIIVPDTSSSATAMPTIAGGAAVADPNAVSQNNSTHASTVVDLPRTEVVAETPAPIVTEPMATAEALPQQKATRVRSVDAAGTGSSMEVRIAGDGAIAFKTFRLENPSRVVIDLNGVRNTVPKSNVAVADGVVKRIRVAQFKAAPDPVTRVVLDLGEKSDYNVAQEGDHLTVRFGAGQIAARSTAPAPVATMASVHTDTPAATMTVVDTKPALQEVKPKNEPAREVTKAAVSAPVAPAPAPMDVVSQVPVVADSSTAASDSTWKMPPAKIPVKTPARASKGATPVITAQADQQPPDTTRTTTRRPSRKAASTTAENVFNDADAQPTSSRSSQSQVLSANGQQTMNGRTLSGGDRVYTGEPISLNLKDADIKDVLRTFAQLTGLNIAVDPGVAGSVTVDFVDVPWDQALDLILRQNGLTWVLEGNVMRIGTVDRLSAETTANRRLQEEERLNVPLTTVSFPLSYARAQEVATQLKEIASPRARIIVDTRTNQLIVSEIPAYLQTMRNLIDSIDVPTRQVVIEARIVETTKNFSQQYGFQWGFSGALDPAVGTGTGLVFPNRVGFTGGPFDFAAGNPVIALTLSDVLGTFNLDFALNAAESEGLVKVVSAPKVTTQDNTAAEIQSGFQIPYQTRVNFTTTITYVDATLRLQVTPQITEAGTVIMDLQIQKTEPALGLAIEGGSGTPLSTRQAKTRLMVRDGGTTVIGGIYQTTDNNSQSRLPFVHQLPIIGNLFKTHNVSSVHDELLIFITPRIVRNS